MKNRISPYAPSDVTIVSRREVNNNALIQTTYELAEYNAFKDMLRAALAKQAMNNTAMLAMAEEYFIRIAPSGKAEYRLIVENYARKALAEILGGDW